MKGIVSGTKLCFGVFPALRVSSWLRGGVMGAKRYKKKKNRLGTFANDVASPIVSYLIRSGGGISWHPLLLLFLLVCDWLHHDKDYREKRFFRVSMSECLMRDVSCAAVVLKRRRPKVFRRRRDDD